MRSGLSTRRDGLVRQKSAAGSQSPRAMDGPGLVVRARVYVLRRHSNGAKTGRFGGRDVGTVPSAVGTARRTRGYN